MTFWGVGAGVGTQAGKHENACRFKHTFDLVGALVPHPLVVNLPDLAFLRSRERERRSRRCQVWERLLRRRVGRADGRGHFLHKRRPLSNAYLIKSIRRGKSCMVGVQFSVLIARCGDDMINATTSPWHVTGVQSLLLAEAGCPCTSSIPHNIRLKRAKYIR